MVTIYWFFQGPCCTTECRLRFGDKCRDDNGCRDASFCDGRAPYCPPSINKPNKTICNQELVCFMGVSVHFSSFIPLSLLNPFHKCQKFNSVSRDVLYDKLTCLYNMTFVNKSISINVMYTCYIPIHTK